MSEPSGPVPGPPPSGRTRGSLLAVAALATALLLALTAILVVTREGGAPAAAAPAAPTAAGSTSPPASARAPGWAPTTPDPTRWAVEEPVSGLTPVSVEIPAIGVESTLLDLGIDAAGVLVPPVPYDVAGWFTGGPVPGDLGPAIIAGHVDSRAGPGVFFRLEEMQPGQKIRVTRSDGSVASFTVRAVDSYPKTAFPTALVYGPTPARELRVITCGGDFDRSRRSYVDNIVVFAVLDR